MRQVWMLALLVGCRVTGEFHCESSEQCRGQGAAIGVCITGSCAFDDADCASGWRYADSAADEVAGACLEGEPPADCGSWKPRHFSACSLPAPLGPLKITGSGAIYDTDRGEFLGGAEVLHTSIALPQADGTVARIMSVASFTLEQTARLRVIGSMPLVIAVWGDATIAGQIDASSALDGFIGPGANPNACTVATSGQAGIASKGSGGGGGGGLGGVGGAGGAGDVDNDPGRAGGTGGAALPAAMATVTVRGGCPGAEGGALGPGAMAPLAATSAARGGAGGGAIQISARGKLVVSGSIHAGGAGGAGGPGLEAGGGGGGSGGFIGLEGMPVTMTGSISANGGGGGGGAGSTATTVGNPGANATATNNSAGGGNQIQCSGAGGNGAAGSTLAGEKPSTTSGQFGQATCGGGGGGGGAGVITVRGFSGTPGNGFSPPPTLDPS